MTEKNTAWWKNETFWKIFEPLMFDSERLQDSRKEVENIISLTGASPGNTILDVGCGNGRHLVHFAEMGFITTGIDYSRSYIKKAEKMFAENILDHKPELINSDFRDMDYSGEFDGAVSLFQSIGYFENPSDDLKVFRNIYNALKPGGWFLVECDGKEVVASGFEERTWFEREGRIILLEYAIEGAWSTLRQRWMFRDTDNSWHETEISYRIYSAMELAQTLEQAGFGIIELFGSLDGRLYDQNAKSLVALAIKT